MKTIIALSIAVLLSIVIAGCSKAPIEEMQAAQSAIDAAKEAEADLYDVSGFTAVTKMMTEAKAAMESENAKSGFKRNYKNVAAMFVSVSEMAEASARNAIVGKDFVRDEVMNLIGTTTADIGAIRETLNKFSTNKKTKAQAESLRGMLLPAENLIAETQKLITSGLYAGAKEQLAVANTQLTNVKTEIEVLTGKPMSMNKSADTVVSKPTVTKPAAKTSGRSR